MLVNRSFNKTLRVERESPVARQHSVRESSRVPQPDVTAWSKSGISSALKSRLWAVIPSPANRNRVALARIAFSFIIDQLL